MGEDEWSAWMSQCKEWHFHVYFPQHNERVKGAALALRNRIMALNREGKLKAVCRDPTPFDPRGPHLIGSFEVWVPREGFESAFCFFMANRGGLSVLVHPLTVLEIRDHREGVWMGERLPLDYDALKERLPNIPVQYPEMAMGYSAKH